MAATKRPSVAMADELNRVEREVLRMLETAEHEYQHAAAMHFKSKCSYEGGRCDALKAVLALLR